MKKFPWLVCALFLVLALTAGAQSFEILTPAEPGKGLIGETVKSPVRFKNNSDKPITLVIRKQSAQLGSTQKKLFLCQRILS